MDPSLHAVWPARLPDTLWNFAALQPEHIPDLPFLGISFDRAFLIAFLFGLTVIAFFGWRRFRERAFDAESFDYRVLLELAPTELRGRNPVFRSYLIYLTVLFVAYAALTFYGKLIFTGLFPILPVAGLQVDVSRLNFSSYEWPLLLAFGFAGFTPLLKPLEFLESWLRSWAHRNVGIPVRIKEQTNRLLDRLNQKPKYIEAAQTEQPNVEEWVRTHLGAGDSVVRILMVREQLCDFLEWHRSERVIWPSVEVRSTLRRLEVEIAEEAEDVLREFDDLIVQDYDAAPKASEKRAQAADDGRNPLQAHQKRLETNLDLITDRMDRLLQEMAAVLAVYAERDKAYHNIRNADLRDLLIETFPQRRFSSGPELALFAMLPFVFAIYAVGVWADYHPLLGSVPKTVKTILVTAGLETARFAILMWLPIAVVFLYRFLQLDREQWRRVQAFQLNNRTSMQRGSAIVMGLLASVLGMFMLANLWAALISTNVDRFQETLYGNFLIYFLTQPVIVIPHVIFCLLAADVARKRTVGTSFLVGLYAVSNGLAVLAISSAHLYAFFYGWSCTGADGIFLVDIFLPEFNGDCIRFYSGIEVLLYCVAAHLAAGAFIRAPQSPTPTTDKGSRDADADADTPPTDTSLAARPAGTGPATAALLVGALALAAVVASVSMAGAQQPPSPEAANGMARKESIVVGFREDAEPFSYRIDRQGGSRYLGYLASLCYGIFSGTHYEVESVPITAANRFALLRRVGDPPFDPSRPAYDADAPDNLEQRQKIDVLCDPITLRYDSVGTGNEPALDRSAGLFSPIVFVSGVSYIARKANTQGDVYLAYVANSTAAEVARRACQGNLFRIDPNRWDRTCPSTMPLRVSSEADCHPKRGSATDPDPDAQRTAKTRKLRYIVCVHESHADLIKWFCDENASGGGDFGNDRVYFGDRDIIVGKLNAWREEGYDCHGDSVEVQPDSFTYEPYALVVTKTNPDLYQHVQRRVYEFFSHRSEATSHFTTYFPRQTMSEALAYLFLLNAVSEEYLFKRSATDR